MKISHLEELKRYLQERPPGELYNLSFIAAEDSYLREQALRVLLNAIPSDERLDLLTLDRSSATVERLAQEFISPSLFSKRRTLLIKEADRLNSGVDKLLLSFLELRDPSLRLILIGEPLKKGPLLQALLDRGLLIELLPPPPWERAGELTGWLIASARHLGKRLQREAAHLLVSGEECRGGLARELDKLITYIGERDEITLDDVKTLRPSLHAKETIWDLGRTIMERNPSRALGLLNALLHDGALAPMLCLYQIRSQLSTHYELASMVAAGHPPQELARAFPQMRSHLTRNKELALSYGLKAFQKALLLTSQADLRMKSESTSPHLILELTIARISV